MTNVQHNELMGLYDIALNLNSLVLKNPSIHDYHQAVNEFMNNAITTKMEAYNAQ